MSNVSNVNVDQVMQIAKRPDLVFIKGEGSWLWDSEGKKYLDFIQGWAVNTLGHCPKLITEVLTMQSQKLINSSPAFYNQAMIDCSNTLVDHSVFDQVFFANSGAEANEGAIKLARKWGQLNKSGAWKIITFENGFHGRTLTTMSASGKAAFEPLFEPKTEGFIKVPFNDINAVKQAIDNQTVAIMLELIQGEAGIISAQSEFVEALRKLADQHDLLFIVDEIQTGVARTGKLFAYEHYNIQPDIMTLAKGLGGGVPIAALLAKEQYCVFEFGDQGGTFNGNPLMTSVANAIVSKVSKPSFLNQVNHRSELLTTGLKALSKKYGLGEVRGKGLLLALDVKNINANEIVASCLEKGLIINAPRDNTLRFMPALNVSSSEIAEMLRVLSEVVLMSE